MKLNVAPHILALTIALSIGIPSGIRAQTGPTSERPNASTEQGSQADPAASPEPGSELRVWLLTAGPGDAVWERYGHNALRVLDTRTGRDVSYNWGIFSFADPVQFIVRFLQGRMLYMMAPFDTGRMIAAYAQQDREILMQELDLSPSEKLELRDLAELNARPENRDYFYQYFLDNCSTRVRDLLDHVLGGALEAEFGAEETSHTYRFHTRRLTEVDPLIFTGMDALLGAPTDARLTVWEEMFIPMRLRDELRDFQRLDADGQVRRLVLSEAVAAASTREAEAEAPPRWFPFYVLFGLLVGGLLALGGTERGRSSPALRRLSATVAVLWTTLAGVLGTILVLLLFTDHVFSTWNENLFLANPLLLGFPILVPLSLVAKGRWSRRAAKLATLVAGIALLGLVLQLVPWPHHRNAMFFALLLPGHLGLAWATRARAAAPDV